mgnify:CR=1 FL=1
MRESRYRYIVARIQREDIKQEDLEKLVNQLILTLFGVNGLSKVLPKVVYINAKKIVVIKVKREGIKIFRASLLLDRGSSLTVLKTTGTLRKAARIADSISDLRIH